MKNRAYWEEKYKHLQPEEREKAIQEDRARQRKLTKKNQERRAEVKIGENLLNSPFLKPLADSIRREHAITRVRVE